MDAGPRERRAPGLAAGAWLVRRGVVRDRRIVGGAGQPGLGYLRRCRVAGRSSGRPRRDRRAGRLRPTTAASLSHRAVAGCGDAVPARCSSCGLCALRPRPLQLDVLMTTATMFACPGCGAETPAGTERCAACRIRLTGELAMQLWNLDQQLASLRVRRQALVDLLRRDDSPGVTRPTFVARPAAGTETRRVLLVLGVV